MLMEVVNNGISLSDAKDVFDLLFNVIAIEDNYTHIRLEWIFGIPQLAIMTSDNNPSLPIRGAKYGDKRFKYTSCILYGTYMKILLKD
jgi:hypothetical protein